MTRRAVAGVLSLAWALAACSSSTPIPLSHRPLFASPTTNTAPPRLPKSNPTLSFIEAMRGVDFSDAEHGMLLYRQCSRGSCRAVVDTTTDGGTHWNRRGVLPPPPELVNLFVASPRDAVAAYRKQYGLQWRPDISAYATQDGGQHWHELVLPDHSVVAAVTRTTIWAYRNRCRNQDGSNCAVGLYEAAVRGGSFHLVTVPPTRGLAIAGVTAPGTGAGVVYLAAGAWYSGGSTVLVSTDSAHTWQASPDPCAPRRGWSVALSTPSTAARTVWALCYGEPGAGSEDKELAISTDAGASWRRRPNPSVGGYGTDIVTTTSTDAWQFEENRADVYLTTDAGRTWRDTLRGRVGESAGAATYWFVPVSTDDAWVISLDARQRSLFLRTTDGGHTWERLPLPF